MYSVPATGYPHHQLFWRWVLSTLIGGLAGCAVSLLVFPALLPTVESLPVATMFVILATVNALSTGLTVGMAQWLAIRPMVPHAHRLIGAQILAFLLIGLLAALRTSFSRDAHDLAYHLARVGGIVPICDCWQGAVFDGIINGTILGVSIWGALGRSLRLRARWWVGGMALGRAGAGALTVILLGSYYENVLQRGIVPTTLVTMSLAWGGFALVAGWAQTRSGVSST